MKPAIFLALLLVLAGCSTAPKPGDIVIPPPPLVRY